MRKIWLISVLAFVFIAMAACASMYSKGERVHRARGTVEAYEPGKVIKLTPREDIEYKGSGEDMYVVHKTPNPNEWVFAITPDTDVESGVKPGIRVLIRYTGSGASKTAVSIDAVWHNK